MIIKIEELESLIKKADDIFLTEKGEEVLVKLLKLQNQIDEAVKEAKLKLEMAALSIDKDFQSIQGDKVKVVYRAWGSRYAIDESKLDTLPKTMYTTKQTLSINTDVVDDFVKANGGLPDGIFEPVRAKQISFTAKK